LTVDDRGKMRGHAGAFWGDGGVLEPVSGGAGVSHASVDMGRAMQGFHGGIQYFVSALGESLDGWFNSPSPLHAIALSGLAKWG
jgi:hypothetical protein